jgi:hypothetical protein
MREDEFLKSSCPLFGILKRERERNEINLFQSSPGEQKKSGRHAVFFFSDSYGDFLSSG